MRSRRLILATAFVVVPFVGAALNAPPASATCRPEKPSTCGCPVGFEPVVTVGSHDVCVPAVNTWAVP